MKKVIFTGAGVAIVTPFTETGINFEELGRLIDMQIEGGTDAIIIAGTMNIAVTIIRCAGLSFVGLGISAPTPEWGSMLAEGRQYIRTAWYLTVIPGLFIMATAYACNLLGDALRDALDPRLKN